jgi:hypothetical protein
MNELKAATGRQRLREIFLALLDSDMRKAAVV